MNQGKRKESEEGSVLVTQRQVITSQERDEQVRKQVRKGHE